MTDDFPWNLGMPVHPGSGPIPTVPEELANAPGIPQPPSSLHTQNENARACHYCLAPWISGEYGL